MCVRDDDILQIGDTASHLLDRSDHMSSIFVPERIDQCKAASVIDEECVHVSSGVLTDGENTLSDETLASGPCLFSIWSNTLRSGFAPAMRSSPLDDTAVVLRLA